MDNDCIGVLSLIMVALQTIFLIVIATTMANVSGKLYWLLNVFAGITQVFTVYPLCRFADNDSKSAQFMIASMINLILSIFYLIEVTAISTNDFYDKSMGGKVTA